MRNREPVNAARGSHIVAPSGSFLMESKNLRALLRYARRSPVVSFHLVRDVSPRVECAQPYAVQVFYQDGARGLARFVDWRVAADFLAARRSWGRVQARGLPEFVARYESTMERRAA